jgi:hypothetical protein
MMMLRPSSPQQHCPIISSTRHRPHRPVFGIDNNNHNNDEHHPLDGKVVALMRPDYYFLLKGRATDSSIDGTN